MDEYRLAFEFWGSIVGLAVIAPLTAAAWRRVAEHLRCLRRDVEESSPLASVPSTPRPSWPS
jgi:hypothetical protein